jgi:hypothetical protein
VQAYRPFLVLTTSTREGHYHEHGKTWLACALGHQACREGWTVLSLRLPRLLQEFPLAKGDGRYVQLMMALAKTAVLILDDWGLAPLSDDNRRDLLELLADRHDCRATIVTSQLPVEHWHAAIGEPTLADAILDRLVHNAYKLPCRATRCANGRPQCPNRHPRCKADTPSVAVLRHDQRAAALLGSLGV